MQNPQVVRNQPLHLSPPQTPKALVRGPLSYCCALSQINVGSVCFPLEGFQEASSPTFINLINSFLVATLGFETLPVDINSTKILTINSSKESNLENMAVHGISKPCQPISHNEETPCSGLLPLKPTLQYRRNGHWTNPFQPILQLLTKTANAKAINQTTKCNR